MIDEIEQFIIEEVEAEKGFVKGDFLKAVEVFWYTVKFFMSQKEMPVIKITGFGTFMPEYRIVKRSIVREIKRIRESNGERSRDRLYRLLLIRRSLINSGNAPKLYYYKKQFRAGKRKPGDEKSYKEYMALKNRLMSIEKKY